MNRAQLAETEAERVARIVAEDKEPKRQLRPCGTATAARRHYKNGEKPCDLCRLASNRRERERDTRRRYKTTGRPASQEVIAAELADPSRADCCGAPLAGGEASGRYLGRHYLWKTLPVCDAAKQARSLYRAERVADGRVG